MLPEKVFELILKTTVTVVAATFGAFILAQAPKRPANQFLAAFLFLISGNQMVETWIVLMRDHGDRLIVQWIVPDISLRAMRRLALIFAAADPFALFYFAGIYPRRNRLNHPALTIAVFAGSLLFFFLAQGYTLVDGDQVDTAWEAFTAVVYITVLVHFARQVTGPNVTAHARVMYYAMCVAALPLIPRLGRAAGSLHLGTATSAAALLMVVVPALLAPAIVIAIDRFRIRSPDAVLTKGALLALAVTIAGFFLWFAVLVMPPDLVLRMSRVWPFFPVASALRWLVFSLLVSMAIFRHDILGMRVAARRRAARAALAIVTIVALAFAYGLVVLAFDSDTIGLRWIDLAIIALALLLASDVRRFLARRADALYGIPPPGDKGAGAEAYRAAVAQARATGATIPGNPDLVRLRRTLDISRETAEWLESEHNVTAAGRTLEVGTVLNGRYEATRFLGRGGTGRVFLARDPLLGRDVVLKEVHETTHAQGSQLLDEAKAAAKVQHLNVVAVHDVVPQTGRLVLVTEYLPRNLAERVHDQGPLELAAVRDVFTDVLSGLDAIHEAGIIHRDLKPDNIFLAKDGTAKVGDFGIATEAAATTLAEGAVGLAGTPGYLAPEVLSTGHATVRSDLYAVGRAIERTADEAALARLEAFLATALADEPADRYRTAHDMAAALEADSAEAVHPAPSRPRN